MEKSLKYAIEKAKRNISSNKYSKCENILDAIYRYCIRPDEVDEMIKSINKWIKKNSLIENPEIYTELDIKGIKGCL